jgi:hypothetical protein
MAIRTIIRVGQKVSRDVAVLSASAVTVLLAGCGSSGPAASTTPSAGISTSAAASPSAAAPVTTAQAPIPAESNPPGDIPDTTVYVPYRSAAAHAVIKVPEGWARQDRATGSTFVSNLNLITIGSLPMSSAPTVATARSITVPSLSRSALAFRLKSVHAVTLPGGPAIEIIYQVNSPPNSVTGRQYRLVIERFEFFRNGRGAVLSLSSAVGSDNVDPWRIVSDSFRWA